MKYGRKKFHESLGMVPVPAGKIRQVEPPKPSGPGNGKRSAPVTPGKAGSKSTRAAKPEPKTSKSKMEHIEGDSHKIMFNQDGCDLTGWIEDRGNGKFDVAIVRGEFTVVKGVSKKDVAEKVRAAAKKLCKKDIEEDDIGEGRPDKAGSDMLVGADEKVIDPKMDDESVEDDEKKEVNESRAFARRVKEVDRCLRRAMAEFNPRQPIREQSAEFVYFMARANKLMG